MSHCLVDVGSLMLPLARQVLFSKNNFGWECFFLLGVNFRYQVSILLYNSVFDKLCGWGIYIFMSVRLLCVFLWLSGIILLLDHSNSKGDSSSLWIFLWQGTLGNSGKVQPNRIPQLLCDCHWVNKRVDPEWKLHEAKINLSVSITFTLFFSLPSVSTHASFTLW